MKNQINKVELKGLIFYFPTEEYIKSTEGLHKVEVKTKEDTYLKKVSLEYYVEYSRLLNKFVAYNLDMKHLEFYEYKDVELMIEEFAMNDIEEFLKTNK